MESFHPYHQPSAQYTGELFDMEYLNQQSLLELSYDDSDEGEDEYVDEGLGDEIIFLSYPSLRNYLLSLHLLKPMSTLRYLYCTNVCFRPQLVSHDGGVDDDNGDDDDGRGESSEAVDAQGIPSWEKVDALARALIN